MSKTMNLRANARAGSALLLLVCCVAAVLGVEPAGAQHAYFQDVADSAYYAVPVKALAADGVFRGTECGDGRFCPDEPVTRWQMAVWVVRMLDGREPPAITTPRFRDVGAHDWYAAHVERMSELGVTQGCGDGTNYCPDAALTRAQMAVFLTRAYHLPNGPDPEFGDVPVDAWYKHAVAALAASGITQGCGDGINFCPDTITTRAQMATFLYRATNRGGGTTDPVPEREPLSVCAQAVEHFVEQTVSVWTAGPALLEQITVSLEAAAVAAAASIPYEPDAATVARRAEEDLILEHRQRREREALDAELAAAGIGGFRGARQIGELAERHREETRLVQAGREREDAQAAAERGPEQFAAALRLAVAFAEWADSYTILAESVTATAQACPPDSEQVDSVAGLSASLAAYRETTEELVVYCIGVEPTVFAPYGLKCPLRGLDLEALP